MIVYAIWDKKTKTFYNSQGNKNLWPTRDAAVDAVMFSLRHLTKDNYKRVFAIEEVSSAWLTANDHYLTFGEQNRFECRKYYLDESKYELV